MNRKLIFLFLFMGSTIGGYVPLLWGDGLLSMSSVILSGVGGLAGIYVGYIVGQRFG